MVKSLPSKVTRRLSNIGEKIVFQLNSKHRAIKVATANSLCDEARLLALQSLAEEIAQRRLQGNVVECGVYRGGSALVLAERLLYNSPHRKMWLFDVFSGMPEPGPDDPPEAWEDVGKFVSSEAIVRESFTVAKLSLNCVQFVVGRYEDTLRNFKPSPIAFLHLDCDWYESVKLCLHTFYDAVVPGGAIVFDDYGHWSGCRKAVDEFLSQRSLEVNLIQIDYTSHYFLKPGKAD